MDDSRSYKMVTVRAMLAAGALRSGLSIDELARRARQIMVVDPRLLADVESPTFPDPANASVETWVGLWRKNPLAALTTPYKGRPPRFRTESDRFEPTFVVPDEDGPVFDAMVAELVEYRLSRYLRDRPASPADGGARYTLKVSHAGGKPIV